MDLSEGDGVHMEHAEGQPAAVASDAREPGAPTSDPAPARTRRKRKGKKRRAAGRPRAVAPAEPDARAAAAAAELAERAAEAPAEPAGEPDALEAGAAGALEAEADPFDPLELAPHTEPVIRTVLLGAALVLRRRGMTRAAESIQGKASAHAALLSGTLGLRIAAALGPKVAILAMLAEVAEPFLADALEAAGKAAER